MSSRVELLNRLAADPDPWVRVGAATLCRPPVPRDVAEAILRTLADDSNLSVKFEAQYQLTQLDERYPL